MSLLTIVTYPTIGSAQSSFTFSFSYLNASDIDAFVDGVKVFENNASTNTAVGGNTFTVAFSSAGSNTLTFSPSVPAGSTVRIQRNSNLATKEVDFSDGSVLTEVALDKAFDQVFFSSQEAIDKVAGAISEDFTDGHMDAQNKRIKNVAAPVADGDAVNKAFISTNLPNINIVAGIASDVTAVAANNTNITAVKNNATNINAVAGNATNINAVNANATNINAVNANATNINAVNSNSANINTVATNSANITTVAGYDQAHLSTVHNNIATLNSISAMFSATDNIAVTVVNSGGNKFALDGVTAPALTLVEGFTYTFDVSDSSNSGHPLAFKDAAGNAFTTGVTVNGTAGSAGATVVIVVPTTGTMPGRYYCTAHGNAMGNTIATQTDSIGTVASNIANVNTVASNLSTIAQKATVDEATALAIALG